MPAPLTRRSFLSTSVPAAVSAMSFLPRIACAADPIVSTELADGLWLLQGAGGNVVAAGGADGVLLVDSGLPERGSELARRVAAVSGSRRVEVLLNTHWHWDHTGGNEV